MRGESWYLLASTVLEELLESQDRVDGFDFLVAFFNDYPHADFPSAGSYQEEEIEFFARDVLDEYEKWLADQCFGWLSIRQRHSWIRPLCLVPPSVSELGKRAAVAEGLSLMKPPVRKIATYQITELELEQLVSAGKIERVFQGIASLSISVFVTACIAKLSMPEGADMTLIQYFLVGSGVATLLSGVGWLFLRPHRDKISTRVRSSTP